MELSSAHLFAPSERLDWGSRACSYFPLFVSSVKVVRHRDSILLWKTGEFLCDKIQFFLPSCRARKGANRQPRRTLRFTKEIDKHHREGAESVATSMEDCHEGTAARFFCVRNLWPSGHRQAKQESSRKSNLTLPNPRRTSCPSSRSVSVFCLPWVVSVIGVTEEAGDVVKGFLAEALACNYAGGMERTRA